MSVIRGNLVGTTMSPEKIAERIGGGGSAGAAVLYTEQNLTGAQKQQARANIEAVSENDFDAAIEPLEQGINYLNELVGDIETALDSILAIQNELIGGDA